MWNTTTLPYIMRMWFALHLAHLVAYPFTVAKKHTYCSLICSYMYAKLTLRQHYSLTTLWALRWSPTSENMIACFYLKSTKIIVKNLNPSTSTHTKIQYSVYLSIIIHDINIFHLFSQTRRCTDYTMCLDGQPATYLKDPWLVIFCYYYAESDGYE